MDVGFWLRHDNPTRWAVAGLKAMHLPPRDLRNFKRFSVLRDAQSSDQPLEQIAARAVKVRNVLVALLYYRCQS